MNSQIVTDSSDDSNAVTVHISKHSQVEEKEGARDRENKKRGRKRGLKNVKEDFVSSSQGKKYK